MKKSPTKFGESLKDWPGRLSMKRDQTIIRSSYGRVYASVVKDNKQSACNQWGLRTGYNANRAGQLETYQENQGKRQSKRTQQKPQLSQEEVVRSIVCMAKDAPHEGCISQASGTGGNRPS